MRRPAQFVTVAATACLALGLLAPAANATPAPNPPSHTLANDNLSSPLQERQQEAKSKALEQVLSGKSTPKGPNQVVKTAPGEYVELAQTDEDKIWTVLGEFGTKINPTYGGTPGPLHNEIPEPDRAVDNTTIWAPDFTKAYYESLLFNDAPGAVSMRNFYKEQSGNRYTVNGVVEDWAKVPFNEANYGSNYCGDIVCQNTWGFLRDTVNSWAAGRSAKELNAYLSQFDVWDRYDYDGDGNFDEPDGYIDHFQAVHAGAGEETGGGAQGTDAIWSHRWYAYFSNIGSTGPLFNKLGGIRVGNSKYWIGDYTVEPENGGVGVFAHEFGHDLGLPDLYDTSGNTGGAENSTGFWSLYDVGSYGSSGKPEDGLGSKPVSMSAYEKIFLGWSNYQVVDYKSSATITLGAANANDGRTQHIVALLPDKQLTTQIGAPFAGSQYYHSGSGNDLDNTMTRQVTLPAGAVQFSAKVRYAIEQDWDYAYLTVNGTPIATNLSTASNPNGQNLGSGITGSTDGAWVDLTADLSGYAGQTVTLGLRYWTDSAVAEAGFGIDEIAVTGLPADGAESDAGWSFDGFIQTTGSVQQSFFNAYYAEYRAYKGYDESLQTGPYNWIGDAQVEHYPYQDGLLVSYYDTSFADNNVGDHCEAGRCGGMVLPVDAHPKLLLRSDGKAWRPRVQSYDSTFSTQRTDAVQLTSAGVTKTYGGLAGTATFDDSKSYWITPRPSIGHYGWSSVQVPSTGTKIRVQSVNAQHTTMRVVVNPATS